MEPTLLTPHTPSPFPLASPKENLSQPLSLLLLRGVSLAKNYPEMEFKICAPSVNVKRRLKNGSYSVKPKQLFPGCVFFRCVMNKELHDFIREYDGIGGFLGSKVGNTKRQINRPKPVSAEDMEAIFRQAKEEQEKTDQAFEEEEKNGALNSGSTVCVLSGTFSGFTGTLKKLNRKTKLDTGGSFLLVLDSQSGI